MISTTNKFDWDSIKRRLREGEAALDQASVASEARLNEMLRQRQFAYAQRTTSEIIDAGARRVLVFLLGLERYAVELPAVVKVFPLSRCTPVPGACKEIVGVINVCGEIRSVVDAAELLSLSPSADRGEGQVILMRHGSLEVGLRVDHVEAIETVSFDSLARPKDIENDASIRFVEGMTPESLIVLSTRQLLSHDLLQCASIQNKGT